MQHFTDLQLKNFVGFSFCLSGVNILKSPRPPYWGHPLPSPFPLHLILRFPSPIFFRIGINHPFDPIIFDYLYILYVCCTAQKSSYACNYKLILINMRQIIFMITCSYTRDFYSAFIHYSPLPLVLSCPVLSPSLSPSLSPICIYPLPAQCKHHHYIAIYFSMVK